MFGKPCIRQCMIRASTLYMWFWGVGNIHNTDCIMQRNIDNDHFRNSPIPNHVIKLWIDEIWYDTHLLLFLLLLFSDEDECTTLTPCAEGRICVNQPGTYVCTCPIGWTGLNCELGKGAMDWRSLPLITFTIIILLISPLPFRGWYIKLPIILATTTNVI